MTAEPTLGPAKPDPGNLALAETVKTVIGLCKGEVIRRRGPWRSLQALDFAILKRVDWFNNRRLLEPISNGPPAEAGQRYYAQQEETALTA